jgi:5-methyltetrahydropteroyltriglutamate--homocysteine methyltransferase
MNRSTDRILVTHVGSLVRPPEIRKAMVAHAANAEFDESVFGETLSKAVSGVVQRQVDCGVDIPSDGEFGKLGWARYVLDRLGGLAPRRSGSGPLFGTPKDREEFGDFYRALAPVQAYDWDPAAEGTPSLAAMGQGGGGPMGWDCVEPVTYKGQAELQRDINNFKSALAGLPVSEAFMPVVAPMSVTEYAPGEIHAYPNRDAYLYAVADALAEEYRAIVDAGFLLQVDDSLFPQVFSRDLYRSSRDEIRQMAETCVDALNHALTGIPEEKVRYHICWASNFGPHTYDAPLKDMVDIMLKVKAQAFSIEAANSRHEHEWMVWEETKLPEGKILIPGLVTHHTMIVEHPELIAWRIENFARLVGRENIIASTDCGFAQSASTVRVHPQIQWAKLKALSEGAALASKRLWK